MVPLGLDNPALSPYLKSLGQSYKSCFCLEGIISTKLEGHYSAYLQDIALCLGGGLPWQQVRSDEVPWSQVPLTAGMR